MHYSFIPTDDDNNFGYINVGVDSDDNGDDYDDDVHDDEISIAITPHLDQDESGDVDKEKSRTVQNYFLIHFVDEILIDDDFNNFFVERT